MLGGAPILVAQALALVHTAVVATWSAALYLPIALVSAALRMLLPGCDGRCDGHARFYEGTVMHSRKQPKEHRFTYQVRMAVVDLDIAPSWWRRTKTDNMTAAEARRLAGTAGPVRLLTHPPAAGYTQNPISVYYCYSRDGRQLEQCIAEVTNTPWAERVTFLFRPGGETVPKALHVSPLMDMRSTWRIKATEPGERLFLSVGCTHPDYGDFFLATFDARLSAQPHLPNETASLGTLLRYGFQPHRVALWIYWHAVLLLWKGVPFFGPPGPEFKSAAAAKAQHPKTADGRSFVWRGAAGWPWNASLAR
ncbi:hypothetical protein ABPG77_007644 [Micractinium sp. CCAP 211/92]